MDAYHDSRSLECRAPRGAVICGEMVRFRLLNVREAQSVRFVFIIDHVPTVFEMSPLGGGIFELCYQTPKTPAIGWYYFELTNASGKTAYYGNAGDMLGGVGAMAQFIPPAYQVTVYQADYKTPDFLRKGVMYQIFPDRYARSKMPASARGDVYLHSNWDERPIVQLSGVSGDNFALDFFGGDLRGIAQRLDYIRDLGVTVLYLNPIFRARTNHRYDTTDYEQIDPLLGTKEDFAALCEMANARGIRVILDGVFSHTGDDSVYFNRRGHYPVVGACQSKKSKYYPWYTFTDYPDNYKSWWGFETLPEVNKHDKSYREFMFKENGVVRQWLARGASGWRLDVADELPMDFLRDLRTAVHQQDRQAALIGEVWEDASHKEAYGKLRSYCLGDTVDSVMNYPLREAVIDFLLYRKNAFELARVILSQQENYAPPFYYSLMNLMGSHDRARVLSVLSGTLKRDDERGDGTPPQLSDAQYALAKERMLKFLEILVSLPGIPCVYYGDEVGLLGAADPYCRGTYPWGREDMTLREKVKRLLALRKRTVLQSGALSVSAKDENTIVIRREISDTCDVFGEPAENDVYTVEISR